MTELVIGACPSQSSLIVQRSTSRFLFATFTPPLRVLHPQQSPSYFFSKKYQDRTSSSITFTARIVSSDSKSSTVLTDTIDLATGRIEFENPDTGGGGDDSSGNKGRGGGGGGDGGKDEGDGGSSEDSDREKKMALSMSQKLTLGYAAFVGMGGLMGYVKSGSQKSLLAGGLSASVLYYVHTQLPTTPVFASSVGLGISAALAAVMGSRFMKSKKIFPAGVVSLVSVIMTGGYVHGILRSVL